MKNFSKQKVNLIKYILTDVPEQSYVHIFQKFIKLKAKEQLENISRIDIRFVIINKSLYFFHLVVVISGNLNLKKYIIYLLF